MELYSDGNHTALRYLGHAGFIASHRGVKLLIDPWFFPAFLHSWFPYPNNRDLLDTVRDERFDFLYISHAHEDHYDERLLRMLDRSITVIVPKYRSKIMVKRFSALGYENVVALGHKESYELTLGFTVTMYLDTSHKEDSGLLLDLDGYRFLDLNDCNTPMSELPGDVDLLAAQYSGAMWYPNCYDYPPDVMRKKVETVRGDLLDTLYRKVRITGAKAYLPSAGPACFLDPELEAYNDRDATIFPQWEDVAGLFAAACPEVGVLRLFPGDTVQLADTPVVERTPGARTSEDLASYRELRRDEWSAFYDEPAEPVTAEEIEAYFAKLQSWNKRFLNDFSKDIRLVADGRMWDVRLGRLAERFVIEGEEPYDPEYTLLLCPRTMRAIIEERTGWEEALLSMRVGLHREPDVFDLTFMSLLRYGNQPVQTMQMLRERQNTETIERDGLRMQRYCPHAGEDLTHATICDGIIECPRHHWKWEADTGTCVDGGTLPLRVEPLDQPAVP
ncbi:putative Rieske 2Fe-2S iron-sulfur protein [Planotetraspora thailandica]|uniref:Putative Rieske 2Fe-2S iron-sulfur protein n=1 Tax=Planotetraspora thailandica TaxID=487172 RepID=A0A8J3V3S7_9ACTN|nr:MBL fold metallo-hydrolase [Planotetraspora thailandica]GII53519.1 putative Rieske 2Fe-2S iron-sulfur protein [Planotetraspora thailandica]